MKTLLSKMDELRSVIHKQDELFRNGRRKTKLELHQRLFSEETAKPGEAYELKDALEQNCVADTLLEIADVVYMAADYSSELLEATLNLAEAYGLQKEDCLDIAVHKYELRLIQGKDVDLEKKMVDPYIHTQYDAQRALEKLEEIFKFK